MGCRWAAGLRRGAAVGVVSVLAASCSRGPPADFAPDPALVQEIRELRIAPSRLRACPGQQISADYEAVLNSGTTVLFERRYDRKRPPPLHVMFLRRTSAEAVSQEDGDWVTDRDPLLSVMNGFRLNAFLRQKPSLNVQAVVEPDYACLPHAFSFTGAPGGEGQAGGDGPDITVRVAILRSPYYDRLLVAGVEVGQAPPFFVFADAEMVPPADWLILESRGGRGGRGIDGQAGVAGSAGQMGCPGGAGGPGGRGGNGGAGAPGGRGGRITIIGPTEEQFVVGLVDGLTAGGPGGPGGRGGKGGAGGQGGAADTTDASRRCQRGADGPAGADGAAGQEGPPGRPGPRSQITTLPWRDVFGASRFLPPQLAQLLEYSEQNNR